MGSSSFYVLDVLAAVAVVVLLVKLSKARKHPPYPPSPPAEPLLGHARIFPSHDQATFFSGMRKTYGTIAFASTGAIQLMIGLGIDVGDVIYLHAFGKSIVVLNSTQAAVDLLEDRNAIYSDRPRNIFFVEMSVPI
jgi:hypothetical protein